MSLWPSVSTPLLFVWMNHKGPLLMVISACSGCGSAINTAASRCNGYPTELLGPDNPEINTCPPFLPPPPHCLMTLSCDAKTSELLLDTDNVEIWVFWRARVMYMIWFALNVGLILNLCFTSDTIHKLLVIIYQVFLGRFAVLLFVVWCPKWIVFLCE